MKFSENILSLSVILGMNTSDLEECLLRYQNKCDVLKYTYKILKCKNEFNPPALNKIVEEYWNKTINGITFSKHYDKGNNEVYILGIIKNVNFKNYAISNPEFEDLYIAFFPNKNLVNGDKLQFLKDNEIKMYI